MVMRTACFLNTTHIRASLLLIPVFSPTANAHRFFEVNLENLRNLEESLLDGNQEDIVEDLFLLEASMFF